MDFSQLNCINRLLILHINYKTNSAIKISSRWIHNLCKLIIRNWIKSKTENGCLCKTYLSLNDKGDITINQLFLLDGTEEIKGMHKIY